MRYAAIFIVGVLFASGCASTGAPDTRKMSGMEMYQQLCSSCHGSGGHGDGPVASLLKIGVPDLTRLAQQDGGEFPTEDVRRAIDGRWDRHAHGARDMPVWGWQLYDSSATNDTAERAQVDSMIGRLVDYLRSIQVN